jgi:hypothetical protein
VDVETPANQAAPGKADCVEPDDASDAPLPLAYGSNRLVFIVRDPTWAQAYWDTGVARINDAVGSLGGGKAFLRLLGVPTGYLLAEDEVCAERGSHGVALPEADRSYAAELAIVHYGRSVVLARSTAVQAPRIMPRPAAGPAFVSRAQQRCALAHGLTLASETDDTPDGVPTWTAGPSGGTRTTPPPILVVSPDSMGSEARLLRAGTELRLPVIGSEGRLVRRDTVRPPF